MRNKTIEIDEKYQSSVKTATIIGAVTVVLNLLLGVSKMVVGKLFGYSAVFSDGVHGTGDILTTLIAVISVWIASGKKNNKYNYGRERWSSICCVVLAVILFVTAGTILTETIQDIVALAQGEASKQAAALSTEWWVSMSLSIAGVVLKEAMFWITLNGAKKAHSTAMKADAWHQRIDALSSVAAIIALCGCFWLPDNNYLDPIFSLPIVIMVFMIGLEVFKKAAHELTDHAIDDEKLKAVKASLYHVVPETQVKLIRSRIYQEKFYLDIFVLAPVSQTLEEADHLSDAIRAQLFKDFDDLKDVYVIIEPDNDTHRKQVETLR
ncbi:MAG: cation diffusion facilitator family transporter [Bacilli bacterium]|jgi:cation diffusion facilitator family transporter|nr:cation diffusion facilitator family transporter [Bacilli bacterium]